MTENHVRVNLAVGIAFRSEILGLKCDEKGFRLGGVNLFDTRTEPFRPVLRITGSLRNLSVHETEHRTHETTCVGLNRKAAVKRRPSDAGMRMNREGMLGRAKHRSQHVGLLRVGHQNAVEIDGSAFLHTRLFNPRERLILEEVKNDERGRMLGNAGEHREILDDTD